MSPRDKGILDALLRDLQARQQLLRAMLEEEEEARPLPFVGVAQIKDGAAHAAMAIRSVLDVREQEQRDAGGRDELFKLLRAASERVGVYVLLLGDAGSHHSDISADVFRGIALADDIAPFVVVNDNDAQAARSFTLLHELAHIWIQKSGVSGPLKNMQSMSTNTIERFCNAVAGEFLLPSASLSTQTDRPQGTDFDAVLRATERIAKTWNVSQALATCRFAQMGWIENDVANRLFQCFEERWQQEKRRSGTSRKAAPSYYVVRRHRLGSALIGTVRRGLQGDVLTHTKAAKILGIKPASVAPLLHG